MKENEIAIIKRLNEFAKTPIQISDFEYSRFDAYNETTIFEIKYRHKYYQETIIEFDKYAYNFMYSSHLKKEFVYAVQMESKIYLFDIKDLIAEGYNFKWEWKEMPATSEFQNKKKKEKYVGLIDIKESIKTIAI